MTALDPAERRRVLRSAIECAIALQPGVRSRQAAPITAAVWRVIRPALEQRDAQITAVRDVIAAMDSTTGARFWAEQLRTALRAQHAATDEPEVQPPLAWCGASMPGIGGQPIGPCVLRNGHDGPVHQAANGARWWPRNDTGEAEPDWGITATEIPSGPTPNCDCGLPGMGFGWHTETCTWKKTVRAAHQRRNTRGGPQ